MRLKKQDARRRGDPAPGAVRFPLDILTLFRLVFKIWKRTSQVAGFFSALTSTCIANKVSCFFGAPSAWGT
jgi:hypothetical protein